MDGNRNNRKWAAVRRNMRNRKNDFNISKMVKRSMIAIVLSLAAIAIYFGYRSAVTIVNGGVYKFDGLDFLIIVCFITLPLVYSLNNLSKVKRILENKK